MVLWNKQKRIKELKQHIVTCYAVMYGINRKIGELRIELDKLEVVSAE
jgi:hypothetical protein